MNGFPHSGDSAASIRELQRWPAPATAPQGLTYGGGRLWVSSLDTAEVHTVDPETGARAYIGRIPQSRDAWAMLWIDQTLLVCHAKNDDDDRVLSMFDPVRNRWSASRDCPGLSGSYLYSDGRRIWMVQRTFGRFLRGTLPSMPFEDPIALPHDVVGVALAGTTIVAIGVDHRSDTHYLTRLVVGRSGIDSHPIGTIAHEPRSLAWDGRTLWTTDRSAGQLVRFAPIAM